MNTIFGKVKNKVEVKEEKVKIQAWDFAKLICTKDKEEYERLKPYIKGSKYSQFLINQALCQDIEVKYPRSFIIEGWRYIKDINTLTLSNEQHYALLNSLIPKNPGFLKNRYKMLKDDVQVEIKAIQWYFKAKDHLAYKYSKIIDKIELEEITEKYKSFVKINKLKEKK